MKPSQNFLKMTIKILILMILFVCLFLISAFLYSVRYWPDVYNYINANITIKRIPTISELDIQIVEVEVDYTTETYTTTDVDYFDVTTIDDFDIDEFMKDELEIKTRSKRNIKVEEMKDYKELASRSIFVDYIFLEEPIEMNNNNTDTEILKTVITGKVLDEEPTPNKDFLAEIHRDESKNKILKRTLDTLTVNEKFDSTIEHTTTKEGYLVGDEVNNEVIHEPTTALFDITTDNEDDYEIQSTRIMKDLVDVSKLTTRSFDVEMVTDRSDDADKTAGTICQGNESCESFITTVFPWVATIFIKNDSENSQFHYFCDGALLSDTVVLTGGRCMIMANESVMPENVLVFLGKGNLQSMAGTEKLHRIREINIHPNFTLDGEEKATNDLALLILDESTVFTENIQGACIHYNDTENLEASATTAWGPNGQLLPIFFEKDKSEICVDKSENVFCATYGLKIALCPSYGGLFAAYRQSRWCLQGMFYGNPADRGLCFNRNVLFTSLNNYINWIDDTIVNKYIIL